MVKRITFFGRVQGVGLRAAAEMLAKKYNIFGWVKNNDDGSVSLVVEGEEENIKKVINHLKRFFQDKIERIDESEEEEKDFREFEIR